MTTYYMNDAAFEVPGLTADLTVHHLAAISDDGQRVALTVHRQPLPAGASIADLALRNARDAALQVRGHQILSEHRVTVAGAPAFDVATTWLGAAGPVYTRQAHVALGETWLVFAVNAPLEARASCDEAIERAITTFHVRG